MRARELHSTLTTDGNIRLTIDEVELGDALGVDEVIVRVATHRRVHVSGVRALPDGRTAEEGASSFVNPMTALSFVETMRAEKHTAIVHTAAASNLGKMLVKICQADGVPTARRRRSRGSWPRRSRRPARRWPSTRSAAGPS